MRNKKTKIAIIIVGSIGIILLLAGNISSKILKDIDEKNKLQAIEILEKETRYKAQDLEYIGTEKNELKYVVINTKNSPAEKYYIVNIKDKTFYTETSDITYEDEDKTEFTEESNKSFHIEK